MRFLALTSCSGERVTGIGVALGLAGLNLGTELSLAVLGAVFLTTLRVDTTSLWKGDVFSSGLVCGIVCSSTIHEEIRINVKLTDLAKHYSWAF